MKQEDGVERAGVTAALVALQQIHGRAAPALPRQDYTAQAVKFGGMAAAMRTAVADRTAALEGLSAARNQEPRAQEACVYKLVRRSSRAFVKTLCARLVSDSAATRGDSI